MTLAKGYVSKTKSQMGDIRTIGPLVENLVPLWTLFTKLHSDFHSVCILELS